MSPGSNPTHTVLGRWSCALILGLVLTGLHVPAWANLAAARFDIPAQPLDTALLAFGQQAGVSIIATEELVDGHRTSGVSGYYFLDAALRELLAHSGLSHNWMSEATVVIDVALIRPVGPTRPSAEQHAGRVPEEIVVTARRREESLQRVPISVTALSGYDLRERSMFDTNDLQFNSPALTIWNIQTRNIGSYSLRGQSGQGIFPAVEVYLADAPVGTELAQYFDMQSVEVLKGPQGTLFGRNTMGGAVLMHPQRPSSEYEGYAQVKSGNLDLFEVEGAVNVPIIEDRVMLRLAGNFLRRDGFTKNLSSGKYLDDKHNESWRISLTLRPTESLESAFIYSGFNSNENGSALVLSAVRACAEGGTLSCLYGPTLDAFFGFPGLWESIGSPDLQQEFARQLGRGPREIESDIELFSERQTWAVVNTTTLELGSVTLKNIASYRRNKLRESSDFDGTTLQAVNLTNQFLPAINTEFTSEEFQVQGTAFNDQLDWITGYYWAHSEDAGSSGQRVTNLGEVPFIRNPQANRVENRYTSQAVFAHFTASLEFLVEGLTFSGGYRHTWDDARANWSLTAGGPDPPYRGPGLPQPGFPLICSIPGKTVDDCLKKLGEDFDGAGWTVGFDYQMNDDTFLYLAHRRGYTGGEFNLAVSNPDFASVDPEFLNDLEVGLKADWAFGKVTGRTNIAAYYGLHDDIVRPIRASVGGRPENFKINAAKASMKGLEFETSIFLSESLQITGFYSLVDAEFREFLTPEQEDLSGRKFAGLAKHSSSVTIHYHLPISADWGDDLVASATYYRQSDMPLTDEQGREPQAVIDAYGLWNVRVDWRNALGSRVDAVFFMKNATDEVYALGGQGISGTLVSTMGEPRTWGFELRYRF